MARENHIIAKEMEVSAKLYDQKMDAALDRVVEAVAAWRR